MQRKQNQIIVTLFIFLTSIQSIRTTISSSSSSDLDREETNSWKSDSEINSDTEFLKNRNGKYSDFRNLHLHESKAENDKISSSSNEAHSRQKRLIWVTDDGRLALPPGTSLTIAPTLALPFVRYPPDGFFSNISVSLPITLDFDKLGLTDNQNPLGVLPPLLARQMGRAAGSFLADYVSRYLRSHNGKRSKREAFPTSSSAFHIESNRIDDEEDDEIPQLPNSHKHAFHGGERALLYIALEDLLYTFGLDGKACLLRAICEIHSKSMPNYGLFGEMAKLFFTASSSPYSHLMNEYVSAEKMGKGEISPGECFPYYKECPKSLFRNGAHKYRKKKTPEEESTKNDPGFNSM